MTTGPSFLSVSNALGLLFAFLVVGYALLGIKRLTARRTAPEFGT